MKPQYTTQFVEKEGKNFIYSDEAKEFMEFCDSYLTACFEEGKEYGFDLANILAIINLETTTVFLNNMLKED